jgi:hypothetical protein
LSRAETKSNFLIVLPLSGCQTAYYSAMEKVGYHKRNLLADWVKTARDSREEAKKEIVSALDEFGKVVGYPGGELETQYNRMREKLLSRPRKCVTMNAVEKAGEAAVFCPKCRSEYREGFYRCPDCRLDLVERLAAEPEPEFIAYEEVLATYNTADIAFLKSVLDSEEIIYYFHGENFSRIDPMIQPARLMVKQDEVEKARELLAGLGISFSAINIHDEDRPG